VLRFLSRPCVLTGTASQSLPLHTCIHKHTHTQTHTHTETQMETVCDGRRLATLALIVTFTEGADLTCVQGLGSELFLHRATPKDAICAQTRWAQGWETRVSSPATDTVWMRRNWFVKTIWKRGKSQKKKVVILLEKVITENKLYFVSRLFVREFKRINCVSLTDSKGNILTEITVGLYWT